MTRLEQYLLSSANDIINSESTESRYYIIGSIKIRVSDHINLESDSDIQIIVPYNIDQTTYTVILQDSKKVLIWNAKQIKQLIPYLNLIKELKTKTLKVREEKKTVVEKIELAKDTQELIFKGFMKSKILLKNLNSATKRVYTKNKTNWNSSEINYFTSLLKQEFNRNDKINEDFQIFLACTPLTYEEAMNIYKMVVIDSNKIPTITLLQKAYSLISVQ